MAISSEWMRFGEHTGFLARPERAEAPMPGVVVVQEAWGVDAHIEDVTRRFAAAGYVALAPDLFSENGERPAALSRERLAELLTFINTMPPAGWSDAKVREVALAKVPDAAARTRIAESFPAVMAQIVGSAALLPKVLAAAAFLRNEQPLTRGQKIGSVGFCMGGGLSALLACNDPQLGAAVIFYGMPPAPDLAAKIACPVLGLFAESDPRINAGVPPFTAAMKAAGTRFEAVTYEGAQHAFFNDGRPSYQARAARDAFVRTLSLFRETLAA